MPESLATTATRPAGSEKKPPGEGGSKRGTGSYLPDIHRSLPYSQDAELATLSSMLQAPRDVIPICLQRINEDHFYNPAHGTIYRILVEFYDSNKPLDNVYLTERLADRGLLDQVGGPAFVAQLFTFVPTAANASYYLDILKEKYILRSIIKSCTECVARAYEAQEEVEPLLDEVEQKILAIKEFGSRAQIPTMKDLVFTAIENIEKLYEQRGKASGLSTGFPDLDNMTDGMHAGEMFVVAARPSMGKTALAMNIAEHVALDQQLPVCVFSLEMSAQQLVQRLICSRARVSMRKIKEGFMPESDFPKLTSTASLFANSKLFIDDTSGLTVLDMRARARRLKDQHDIQLIVIDYLQLLRSSSRRAQDNRQLEIAEISYGVKALSKELKVPIIVLAQLNRKPEDREGGRPRLSDLRESGSIEQDADIVGLLVRSAYYADDDEKKEEVGGAAELIIAKQRNGPVGDVPLTFLKEFTRFEPRARAPEEG